MSFPRRGERGDQGDRAANSRGSPSVTIRLAMNVHLHHHARERMTERGATEPEVISTVLEGESIPAKFGRSGFRRNFAYNVQWQGRWFATKQVEAFAAPVSDGWLVITVIVKYF